MSGATRRARGAARPRRTPTQQRGARRVQEILDATEQAVIELGIDAVTTNHIARRAGVNVGTLYHFFSNKIEIFCALLERANAELEAQVRRATQRPARDAGVWVARVVDAHAEVWLRRPAVVRVWEALRDRDEIHASQARYDDSILPVYEDGFRRYCPGIAPGRRRRVANAVNVVIAALLDDAVIGAIGRERAARLREVNTLVRSYVCATRPAR